MENTNQNVTATEDNGVRPVQKYGLQVVSNKESQEYIETFVKTKSINKKEDEGVGVFLGKEWLKERLREMDEYDGLKICVGLEIKQADRTQDKLGIIIRMAKFDNADPIKSADNNNEIDEKRIYSNLKKLQDNEPPVLECPPAKICQ